MAFIGISVPHEAARLVHEIDVPGDKEDSAHLHITLLYLGRDFSIKELSKAMMATYEVTRNTSPFRVKLGCIDHFDVPDKRNFPIIAPAQSIKIHELNAALKRTFNKKRIAYDKTFKEYKPHVTLSFNKDPVNKSKIEPIEWSVHELVLWGGSNGDNRVFVTFPLDGIYNKDCDE